MTERCWGGLLLLFLKAAGEFAAERSSLEGKIQSLQGTRTVNRTMLYINATVPGHMRNGKKKIPIAPLERDNLIYHWGN